MLDERPPPNGEVLVPVHPSRRKAPAQVGAATVAAAVVEQVTHRLRLASIAAERAAQAAGLLPGWTRSPWLISAATDVQCHRSAGVVSSRRTAEADIRPRSPVDGKRGIPSDLRREWMRCSLGRDRDSSALA